LREQQLDGPEHGIAKVCLALNLHPPGNSLGGVARIRMSDAISLDLIGNHLDPTFQLTAPHARVCGRKESKFLAGL
jgi:hypothetical protein